MEKICFLEGHKRGFTNRCLYFENEFFLILWRTRKKCRDWWKTEKQVTHTSLISRTNRMETRWGWLRSSYTRLVSSVMERGSENHQSTCWTDLREVYYCISQGINYWPWSLAVSWNGKIMNSLNYSDRSRKTDIAQKGSSLHRLSLRWCSDYKQDQEKDF